MFFFEGSKCPVCSESFAASDDVVACPVCGTPHHRACYKENGGCACEQLHAEGYVWQSEAAEAPDASAGGRTCPVCGSRNPECRLYCESCGSSLLDGRSAADGSGTAPQSESGFVSIGGQTVISDGELIEDVPVGDMKRFVGSSAFYYVPQFVLFARGLRRITFNFFAFLAHGLWFISRKMYALGGALLAAQLAVFAFQTYCTVQLAPFINASSADYAAAYAATEQLMAERPLLVFGMLASVFIQYGILFFSGLFGNRVYMDFCVKKIRKCNSLSETAEQFNERLESCGGSALAPAIGCGVLYIVIRLLLQNRMGM